jgi:hypothetical protein
VQVLQVCWDGKLVHVCSLLQGTAPALLGALADRLLVATKPSPAGEASVNTADRCLHRLRSWTR